MIVKTHVERMRGAPEAVLPPSQWMVSKLKDAESNRMITMILVCSATLLDVASTRVSVLQTTSGCKTLDQQEYREGLCCHIHL